MAGTQIGSSTNFPQGFANGVSVRGIPLLQAQPGQVFFVGNSPFLNPGQRAGSDGNRGTFLDPFATVGYADAAAVPGRGDIVFILPGHKETISAPYVARNTSNIAFVGLGSGNFRPTFTFTAANATFNNSGDGVSIQNILFVGNFLSIASAITGVASSFTGVIANNVLTTSAVTGTVPIGGTLYATGITTPTVITAQLSGTANGAGTYAVNGTTTLASSTITTGCKDFSIDNCEFRDTSGVLGFLSIWTPPATANSADGFSMTRCNWFSQSTVSPTVAITTGGFGHDRWDLSDNYMVSPTTAVTEGPIMLAAGAGNMTNISIGRNRTQRLGVSTTIPCGISTSGTAWSGHCFDNYFGTGLSGATGIWINTGTKLSFSNNYSMITRAADKSALINPAAV